MRLSVCGDQVLLSLCLPGLCIADVLMGTRVWADGVLMG